MGNRPTIFVWAILSAILLFSCIKGETGIIEPVSNVIEGIEWQLVEMNGTPVSPPTGVRRPFLKLDADKKQANGYASCNNFFGGFELAGASLKFGPVGATRKACPDQQMHLETEFFRALDKTRAWEMRNGMLLLLDSSEVIARFKADNPDAPPVDLQSMTFRSSWFPSGKVTLAGGEYREPAAPGSSAEKVVRLTDKQVFGLLNSKETVTVVLVTETGGSGTFYDLALISNEAGGWVNTDTVALGDRVEVHAIEITGDTIIIPMKIHGTGDSMCCPSHEVLKRFNVRENRLVPVAGEKPGKNMGEITGTVWQWKQTLYNDDRKAVPADPRNYTVQFRADGTLTVKADCNLQGGNYSASAEDKTLSIEITHSTMAACPDGSLEEEFVQSLSAAAIYFIRDGDLFIDLKYDSGTIRFSKLNGE